MEKLLSVISEFEGKNLYVTGTCSGDITYSYEIRDWEYEQYDNCVVISGRDCSGLSLSDSYLGIYEEDGEMWILKYEGTDIIISSVYEQNKD